MALSVIREYTPRAMKIMNEYEGRVWYFHGECSIFSHHTKIRHPILLLLYNMKHFDLPQIHKKTSNTLRPALRPEARLAWLGLLTWWATSRSLKLQFSLKVTAWKSAVFSALVIYDTIFISDCIIFLQNLTKYIISKQHTAPWALVAPLSPNQLWKILHRLWIV